MNRLEVDCESKFYKVQRAVETVFSKALPYTIKFEFRRTISTDQLECITELECEELNFSTTQKRNVTSVSDEVMAEACATVEGSLLAHLLSRIRTLEAEYLTIGLSPEQHNDSNHVGVYWWRQLKNTPPIEEARSNEVPKPKHHIAITSAYQTHSAYGYTNRIDYGYRHSTEIVREFAPKPHVVNSDLPKESLNPPSPDFEVSGDLAAKIFQLKELAAVLLKDEVIKNKVPIELQVYLIPETLIKRK